MNIAFLGFAGAARIEAEAGAQLVRLERYSGRLSDCRLAVEALPGPDGLSYDARLDLVMRAGERLTIGHCLDRDPQAAVRAAFDGAVREMERRAGRGT